MQPLRCDLSAVNDQVSMMETYLVIGASGTIGSAVVLGLARPGVVVGLQYCHNRSAVEQLQESLAQVGARGVCLQSALDSEASCVHLWERVCSELGVIHGMALCGGRVPWRAWQELAASDWQQTFFEHCVMPFTLARLTIPEMQKRGEGRIVYLSSIAAKYGGSPRSLHYAAAKSALETSMRGLSRDVARAGIRINGVRSGFVHSPQQQAGRSAQEIAERIEKIPMQRPGKPEEVAAAMGFLLSADASYVTGEIITVAGGD